MTFIRLMLKLAIAVILSSTIVRAHEVVPTIADLAIEDGQATLSMRINIEAFLAGVDLDSVENTDNSAEAGDYNALRALPADEIATRAALLLTRWNAAPLLSTGGGALALGTASLTIPEGIDPELPRIAEWQLVAPIGSDAQTITVTWPDGAGSLVLRQQGVEAPFTGLIEGGSVQKISLAGGNQVTGLQAFTSYVPVGFDHILPKGLDHILFVLGLFLLSTRLSPLLWQVTTFTLAHTVTLALGALGLVSVPGSIVEPLIAASIVYVAVENIWLARLTPWRPFVIFGFGLLHGLGFASVLAEFGLPEGQFIPALVGFNVGVELGQLTVIAMAGALLWLAWRAVRHAPLDQAEWTAREYPVMFRAVSVTGSLIIAIIGAYWVIERVFL